uniref:Ig-like domain-containing protein n=1 Tax=Ficedula albicollis TaxID=59894 RepID=A0A803V336_FICAL
MPRPCPAVPSPVVALAGWCPLSPAGAQSTQLLVEPPWTPAVLWDWVTLTCQGSGTASSGTYQCQRPGSGLSPTVRVSNEPLVLQVPARALLDGDKVTLRCQGWQDNPVTRVRFYKDEKELGQSLRDTEMSLSPLELHNSSCYRCRGWVASGMSLSAPVTVKVHAPCGPSDLINLSCLSTPSPLWSRAPLLYRFYRDGQLVGGPQGSSQLLVPAMGVSHSRNYSCEVRSEVGAMQKITSRLGITVCSECGDGHGEFPQPSQVSHPCSTLCVPPCLPTSLPGSPITFSADCIPHQGPSAPSWVHLSLSDVSPFSIGPTIPVWVSKIFPSTLS